MITPNFNFAQSGYLLSPISIIHLPLSVGPLTVEPHLFEIQGTAILVRIIGSLK
jgi:hypothetical protein